MSPCNHCPRTKISSFVSPAAAAYSLRLRTILIYLSSSLYAFLSVPRKHNRGGEEDNMGWGRIPRAKVVDSPCGARAYTRFIYIDAYLIQGIMHPPRTSNSPRSLQYRAVCLLHCFKDQFRGEGCRGAKKNVARVNIVGS